MAEYVRFVSYLYEYQGNERKKNIGFVRYEVRAGQKRLTVSVNGVRRPDERIPVYAFYREMDSCIGVKLGTLVLRSGRGTFQYSTYADGPGEAEPECRFEEIAGVMVMGEADTPVFCTVWDNEPFLVSAFVRCRMDLVRIRAMKQVHEDAAGQPAEEAADTAKTQMQEAAKAQPPEEQAPAAEEQDSNALPSGRAGAESEENVQPLREQAEQAKEHADAPETEPEDLQKRNEIKPEPAAQKPAQEPEEQPVQEHFCEKEQTDAAAEEQAAAKKERMRESYALYQQTIWERMCKLYPKVMPFPYNCQIGALRIRPGDIGRLPKENWPMANNSFMLHGFFQYRYILLLRLPAQTSEYEERYMIAVPGIYSQMDNYLADMFGFHEFLGSPKQGSENGRFGYWVQEVRMEQRT